MSKVLGVFVIARNGDREEFPQDPKTYEPGRTRSTPLGAAESYQLGAYLRSVYLAPSSSSYISGMKPGIVDKQQVRFFSKAGGEGAAIFDSTMALLQGMYPPDPNNRITLANETTIVAPLGGYQYVPIEVVEPFNDRSLEPWTDCMAFQRHVADVYASEEFKKTAKAAQPFLAVARDYVYGRPTTLENIWNIFDYINTQLIHNQTYAYRLPPTIIEKARGFANYHEHAVFSAKDLGSMGNVAGRTMLHSLLDTLDRIAMNDDPIKFALVETSYQPFISLIRMLELTNQYPELAGIPDYASALAFEVRRGAGPELRDFLRIKFKNGSAHAFETYHAFDHRADIPVTEFVYKLENYAITSQKQWYAACSLPFYAQGSRSSISMPVFACLVAMALIGALTLVKRLSRIYARNLSRTHETQFMERKHYL